MPVRGTVAGPLAYTRLTGSVRVLRTSPATPRGAVHFRADGPVQPPRRGVGRPFQQPPKRRVRTTVVPLSHRSGPRKPGPGEIQARACLVQGLSEERPGVSVETQRRSFRWCVRHGRAPFEDGARHWRLLESQEPDRGRRSRSTPRQESQNRHCAPTGRFRRDSAGRAERVGPGPSCGRGTVSRVANSIRRDTLSRAED